jgi:phosphopantothenoylcysteine decarboxylase / phosphopantothenate---cysteine ligase
MEQGEAAVLVAPTMHGSLHTSILTASLERLAGLGVRVIPPREDYGKHNLPPEEVLVAEVCRAVSASPLKGVPVLVTGGPTPVAIDGVRRITSRFSGRLGARIAEELYLRGAAVRLIQGQGAFQPPAHLSLVLAKTYDDYRRLVSEEIAAAGHRFGVFTAAVADYRPREERSGKTPSGAESWALELVPTAKVIREVRERFPELYMVTFKLEEGVGREELLAIARRRLAEGYQAVVANRGEEMGPGDEQVAYLVTGEGEPRRMVGKPEIARGIADHLEAVLKAAVGGGPGLPPEG